MNTSWLLIENQLFRHVSTDQQFAAFYLLPSFVVANHFHGHTPAAHAQPGVLPDVIDLSSFESPCSVAELSAVEEVKAPTARPVRRAAGIC
jgi:hypothetical protein